MSCFRSTGMRVTGHVALILLLCALFLGCTTTVPVQALGGPPNRPTAPTLVSATGGDGTVTLTWAPPQATGGLPVTGYKVEYATNSAMTSGLVVDNANTATSPYTITGLTNSTQYYVRVTAISAAGEGTGSVISVVPNGTQIGRAHV